MEQTARDKFFERIEGEPLAAQSFLESANEHFRQSNDVDVRFSHTTVANMRLWSAWETDACKQRKQIFPTVTWHPKNRAVLARNKLTPEEFSHLGVDGAVKPKAKKELQNSEIQPFEDNFRHGVFPFIHALETTKMKLSL